MAERRNTEMGLVDGITAEYGGPRTAALLDRLNATIPWNTLVAPILALPEYQAAAKGGRPAWPALTMLKCILLAKWFGLSDPQLEECLQDRLSFRRFVGLSLHDGTPDETTFVRFRARLREANLDRRLFDDTVTTLERRGLLVRQGTLVDATIIEQSRGGKRDDGTSTRDPEASYTSKHGRAHHGFKGHIAADFSGVVTDFRFTTAKEHDSTRIDELTEHERSVVVADAAYSSADRRSRLRRRGVIDAIAHKRHRGQKALTRAQKSWNRDVSRLRARVEHPFAWMKQMAQGFRGRCRYRGRRRNELDFALNLAAYNWKRSLSLATA